MAKLKRIHRHDASVGRHNCEALANGGVGALAVGGSRDARRVLDIRVINDLREVVVGLGRVQRHTVSVLDGSAVAQSEVLGGRVGAANQVRHVAEGVGLANHHSSLGRIRMGLQAA